MNLNMKKRLFIILAVVLSFALLFSGCKTTDKPEATTAPEVTAEPEATAQPPSQDIVNETDDEGAKTITDVLGNELELPKEKPTKIVSLTPANTEMLFALGLGEYVIGVDEYSNYPEEALEIAKVGDFNGPNVEAIVALEPNLVLAGNKLQAEAITKLKEVGLNVAAVEATTYEEIFASIKLVGDLTMTSDEAQALIDQMKAKEKEIVDMAKEQTEKVSAYFVLSAGEYGNWTSGPGSLINDMFALIGVEAITNIEGGEPWMDYSLEKLVEQDPDILIVSAHSFLTMEDIESLDGYKDLSAVKDKKVYFVDGDITGRPSVRIVEALELIYNTVYNPQGAEQ